MAKKKSLEKLAEKHSKNKKNTAMQKKADDAANMLKYLNHMTEIKTIDEEVQRLRQEQIDRMAQIETLKTELAQERP